ARTVCLLARSRRVRRDWSAGSQQIILDRDLQLVVNSLWESGAEASAHSLSTGEVATRTPRLVSR
ncbi:hypothetical protein GR254_24895, partial [Mycobacterium tuberculosis]|nr:hypothetical protein [Mycobacterium tuberculosis]